MTQFDTANLVGNRVRVSGTDRFGKEGETVLDSTQWTEVNGNSAFKQAQEDFDRAVESFFAPLTEASSKLNKQLNKPRDPLSYVVLSEAVEGQQARPEQLIKLTPDSIVLRLLEQGDHDRLVWVGEGLEVLEVDDALPFEEPSVSDVVAADEAGETVDKG